MTKLGSNKRFDLWIGLVVASSLALVGCPGDEYELTIEDPVDGATLNVTADVDPDTAGIQIGVRAIAVRAEPGLEVLLVVDGADGPTANVMADGTTRFPNVTLDPGTHTLQALNREDGIESDEHTVTVVDGCGNVSFVLPEPPASGALRLGPDAAVDGDCDGPFQTRVVVSTDAGDGAMAQLLVNGALVGEPQSVAGAAAEFPAVTLGNRGDDPNQLAVRITGSSGFSCDEPFPTPVFVDCLGASCNITDPVTPTGYLNSMADGNDTPGFQGAATVNTSSNGVDQPVRLEIDGDEQSVMANADGDARFDVDLPDGTYTVEAFCEDGLGNVTPSGQVTWIVDTEPCNVTFTEPDDDQLFIDSDDADPGTPGLQVVARGTSDGPECTGARVSTCPAVMGLPFETPADSWMGTVTLSSMATQELCAQVEDVAGNIGEARRTVRVQTDAPPVEIETPMTGAAFNNAVDLDPPSNTCEVDFTVLCDDGASDVELIRDDTMAVLDTAPCTADGTAPAPYTGRASFSSVSLPSLPSLAMLSIHAEQTLDRLTGVSGAITVTSDCDPPDILPNLPSCGDVLRPVGGAPVRRDVEVFNTNVPQDDVVLTLMTPGGMTIGGPFTSSTHVGGRTRFTDIEFGSSGDVVIEACSTDAAGNQGCFPSTCTVTVADIPMLAIIEPLPMAVLSNASTDCDPGTPGTQFRVRATTDAADGSSFTVSIGSVMVTGTVSGGMVDACVPANDGRGQTLRVEVNAGPPRGTAMATTTVSVDTMPPTTAVTDFTPQLPAVDVRGGLVSFTWTDVEDAGAFLLDRYEVRCSNAAITTEMQWDAAGPSIPVMAVPGTSGSMKSETFDRFRLLDERFCVIRGADIAGELTPLPSTPPTSVTLTPTETVLTGTALGTGMGSVVRAVGDVDGDGIDDILAGSGRSAAEGAEAYLFFGGSGGPSTTPDVTIRGPAGAGGAFALRVAGVGDLNSDGRQDFAVSAFILGGLSGEVFVFFGRPSAMWPSLIDLSTGCPADLCIAHDGAPALFGFDVESAGDFDGDGFDDLAIGAWRANTNGRVYVMLGDPSLTPAMPLMGFDVGIPSGSGPAVDGFIVDAPMGVTFMGTSVTTCGDLDGGGTDDLLIGAAGNDPIPGALVRVDGRSSTAGQGWLSIPTSQVSTIATGTFGSYGGHVRCVGDFDGDSRNDVAVYNAGTGGSAGNIELFYQRSGTYSRSASTLSGNGIAPSADDFHGYSIGLGYTPALDLLGDIDGDGLADLIAGSRQTGSAVGSLAVFYGRPAPPASLPRSQADGLANPPTMATTSSRFAAYVGDVNGDGAWDYAIGDPDFGGGAGRVLVYY